MRFILPVVLCAFSLSILLTWLVRKAARAWGILDHPDGQRKLHRAPIPLLGGVAVFGAWSAAMMVGSFCDQGTFSQDKTWTSPAEHHPYFPGGFGPSIVLAAGVVLLTGILDDVVNLKPRWKLLGQTLAAAVLIASGLSVRRLWLYGFTVDLGWAGIVFSLVWLVGSMNSINMLDGLDGLASTLGLVIALTLSWMAWLTGNPSLGLVALALAGALAGFLVFNYPPASIFLGDSGSMLIGLVIGAVAIQGSFKGPATAALVAPVAVLAIPIFDGLEAVIRRRLSGRAISSPDRGHIHHCLLRIGWSNQQIVAAIGGVCAVTGVAVLLSLYFRHEPIAVGATVAVGISCLAAKLFAGRKAMQTRAPADTSGDSEVQERTAA